MKIVIAPNAFKGSLSSTKVASSIEQGIRKILNNVEIEKIPLADGGDDTLEVLLRSKGGKIYKKRVKGPLWDEIDSEYGILEDGTAVIEMAKASGLALLSEEERNPLYTTTYGTGELILDALDKGAQRIIVGVGGSATCDGGIGALAALGSKFLDANGREVKPVGENLKFIKNAQLNKKLEKVNAIVACDVLNPLLGEHGAAKVYAPQKGASNDAVKILEEGLEHFSSLTPKGLKIRDVQMAGASGGLSFGLALIGAELRLGAELIMEMVDFGERARYADIIITGEGKMDRATSYGKVSYTVMQFGKKNNIPVIGITGSIGEDIDELYDQGLTTSFSLAPGPMALDKSMRDAPKLIEDVAERIARMLKVNKSHVASGFIPDVNKSHVARGLSRRGSRPIGTE